MPVKAYAKAAMDRKSMEPMPATGEPMPAANDPMPAAPAPMAGAAPPMNMAAVVPAAREPPPPTSPMPMSAPMTEVAPLGVPSNLEYKGMLYTLDPSKVSTQPAQQQATSPQGISRRVQLPHQFPGMA